MATMELTPRTGEYSYYPNTLLTILTVTAALTEFTILSPDKPFIVSVYYYQLLVKQFNLLLSWL